MEYLLLKLPAGVVPKSVGFERVFTMELNEYAAQGWRVVSATRAMTGFTPMEVLLERPKND